MELKQLFSDEHMKHIKGGYFQKGCDECARFIGKYKMSGRKFKGERNAKTDIN